MSSTIGRYYHQLALRVVEKEGSVLESKLKVTRKEKKNFIPNSFFTAVLTIFSNTLLPKIFTNNV